MRTFTDKAGGKWAIELPIGTIIRVKADSGGKFDLFEPWKVDGKSLTETLWEDLGEFFELLAYLVDDQLTERGITAADFGKLMAADCIILARLAFFDEWRDFFRDLQRPNVAAALEKTTAYQAKLLELVTKKMNDPRMTTLDQKMTTKMEALLNNSFGNSLDSLESTLAVSPGDS